MKSEKINRQYPSPTILVAPLDWGLGHTTRCIPIISTLQKAGAEVICAGDANAESIINAEFPGILFLPLKGYEIKYPNKGGWFLAKMATQLPGIIKSFVAEKAWLAEATARYHIDGIISDNRPGLYHSRIPSVYITHQLEVSSGVAILDGFLQKTHLNMINRFHQCWIPDTKAGLNLAGNLSHPGKMPGVPVSYLGVLSRFNFEQQPATTKLTVILSGPEPQRSILEKMLLAQLTQAKVEATVIRGLPQEKLLPETSNNIQVFNHLPAEKLNRLLLETEMVICRAGYSSIMDLVRLKRKAILIPTPGQGEQEYLAKHVLRKKIFYSVRQKDLDLQAALSSANQFYQTAVLPPTAYNEAVILSWLDNVRNTMVEK